MSIHKERRNFPRIQLRANAELETAAGRWPVQLVDLSFSGALVACSLPFPPSRSETVTLHINLNQDHPILMRGHLVHSNGSYLGLECSPTGVDQRASLRKLFSHKNNPTLG